MASYRLSAAAISRTGGRSVVAAAAYRSGTRLIDERTGEVHDFSPRRNLADGETAEDCAIADAFILVPECTPDWMRERERLWNAVEAMERRKDAQLCREVQISLPFELTDKQRLELVQGFVRSAYIREGMIADVAIHRPQPDKGENEKNYHAHIMLTMREITGNGFNAKKARHWNDKKLLEQWRQDWANRQNEMLEKNGHKDRVSHLSLEAQGIEKLPQIHLGAAANQALKDGKSSRIVDDYKRIQRINLRLDRLEKVRKGRQLQLHEAKREWAQLQQSIRKKGLLGWWDKLTGKRRDELLRSDDALAAIEKANADDAKLKLQQSQNRQEQARILKRQAEQKKKKAAALAPLHRDAANDDSRAEKKPPDKPQGRPRPEARGRPRPLTEKGRPRPAPLSEGRPRPQEQGRTRPQAKTSARDRKPHEPER